MKFFISEKQPLSDERLDALLASLREEGAAETEENIKPPVINLYRLEREKERRRSDAQLKLTAAAVSVSVLLTTIITTVLLKLLWANTGQILQIPAIAKAYGEIRWFFLIYGREIGAIALTFFTLTVLGYLLCAVLLVRNRDKILIFGKNP